MYHSLNNSKRTASVAQWLGVVASSAVDRRLESPSGQTKDYKIGIFCSPLSSQH
jgi:hypothetical protein